MTGSAPAPPDTRSGLRLSIIVCTRNRLPSLRGLLEDLALTLRDHPGCEVVIADNGESAPTGELVREFAGRIPLRHLLVARRGKGHCLHAAADPAHVGALVAVLDDDMHPAADWAEQVFAVSAAHPESDFFGGYVYPIWPIPHPPAWVHGMSRDLLGWTFSAHGYAATPAPTTHPQPLGYWPCGNHHWFRRTLLENGNRFEAQEPDSAYEFILAAQEAGHRGMATSHVVAGHRIQPNLLDLPILEKRARNLGRMYAQRRLRPFRRCVRAARMMHDRPRLGRLFCLARWVGFTVWAPLTSGKNSRFWVHQRLHAVERSSYYRTVLREVASNPDYPAGVGSGAVARSE